MPAAIRRCASRVEFSLMTVKATCPGWICFKPSLREINLQLGGKMEDTRTILHAAMPALRSASSKLDNRSRCFPTPFVRKIFFATNAMSGAEVRGLLGDTRNSRELQRVRESNKKCDTVSISFPLTDARKRS